jgi:hypothetical protein
MKSKHLVIVALFIAILAVGINASLARVRAMARAAAIAQAEFENNVNEMAKLLVTTSTDNGKPPAGWRVAYTYKENGHDKNKVFVNDKTKQVVMGYGGTQMLSATDWAKNLDAGKQSLKLNGKDYGKVHNGFYKQFQRTEQGMFGAAAPYLKQGYKLEITGHSQGGAAATIASAFAKEKYGVADPKVVTFGSPSVGDKQFAKMYNSRVNDNTRVVNSYTNMFGQKKNEVVPSVPFPVMGYQHVGKLKSVTTGKGDWTAKVGNHMMENYERATVNKPVLDKKGLIARTVEKGFNAAKNGVAKVGGKVVNGAKNMGNKARTGINNVAGNLSNRVKSTVGKVRNTARNVVSRTKGAVNNGVSKARGAVSTGVNKARSTISNGINKARSTISKGISTARSTISKGISSAKSTISNGISRARSTISNGISSARSTISSGISRARSTIGNGISSARSSISSGISSARSTISSGMSRISSGMSSIRSSFSSAARSFSSGGARGGGRA